jgi:Flp pilus assembly protein TadB
VTRVQIATLAAALLVGGAVLAARGMRPRPPSVAALRARYFAAVADRGVSSPRSRRERMARAVAASELGIRLDARAGVHLRAAGLTTAEAVARAITACAVGGLTAVGVVTALVTSGLAAPSPLLVTLVPLAAALSLGSTVAEVRSRAATARTDLRQAAADFVQLVAVSLTTSRSVEESVEFASRAGSGAGFDLIRRAVVSAPQAGLTTWEALDEVGRRYDVSELRDLAASIQRQASVGASVEQTVSTLAASMRAKALDELERAADRANSNLSGPTIGFVVGMILLLAYPLAVRVSEAFHP